MRQKISVILHTTQSIRSRLIDLSHLSSSLRDPAVVTINILRTPWTKDYIVAKCTAYSLESIVYCNRYDRRYCMQHTVTMGYIFQGVILCSVQICSTLEHATVHQAYLYSTEHLGGSIHLDTHNPWSTIPLQGRVYSQNFRAIYRLVHAFDPKFTNQEMPSAITHPIVACMVSYRPPWIPE